MQAPTRHFSWSELGDPPAHHREATRHLAHHLEHLRTARGDRPLKILSAYRGPRKNASVGGATASLHLQGRAADIPRGYARTADAVAAGFTGIGSTSDGWAIHVDVRTGPRARWTY